MRQNGGFLFALKNWPGNRLEATPATPAPVKVGRDEQRVRQRYLRMSKEALVTRLMATERSLAEQRDRWLSQQDEILTWQLRAKLAEGVASETDEEPRIF